MLYSRRCSTSASVRWPVGHDHVDPEVEQAAHLVRLVYGPRVHPHAPSMRRTDEARGHERYAPVSEGNLNAS